MRERPKSVESPGTYVTKWVYRGHLCLTLCSFGPPSHALLVITWRGEGCRYMMRLGYTVKRTQLLNIKTRRQVYGLRGVSWWLCVCFTWLDMTTPPWCREKVMVYYYYYYYNFTAAILFYFFLTQLPQTVNYGTNLTTHIKQSLQARTRTETHEIKHVPWLPLEVTLKVTSHFKSHFSKNNDIFIGASATRVVVAFCINLVFHTWADFYKNNNKIHMHHNVSCPSLLDWQGNGWYHVNYCTWQMLT